MDLFATAEEIAELERKLTAASANAQTELMGRLAWLTRQSDTERAVQLADQVSLSLTGQAQHNVSQQLLDARMDLVRGESAWLLISLAQAEQLANRALQQFTALQDGRGCADAHWLLAWIANDTGNLTKRDLEFSAMAEAARLANDQIRVDVAQAALARWLALSNRRLAEERHAAYFRSLANDDDDFRAMWSNEFLGILSYCGEDAAVALSYTMQAYKQALHTGQIYFAIVNAVNIADAFNSQNEHLIALDWIQRGLDLARRCGWARSIGACLVAMAEILRHIQNIASAQEILNEALKLLAPIHGSRIYAMALGYRGSLALDQQDYVLALEAFRELEERAFALQQIDFKVDYLRGQALALSHLDQPADALRVAQRALALLTNEQGEGVKQIEILMMFADILTRHPALHTNQTEAQATPTSYLYQALSIAENLKGYIVPARLYQMLSREYASALDFELAWVMANKAIEASDKAQSHAIITRASTIQVLHKLERVREDSEMHRQVALSESKRSQELLLTTNTLEQLGAIGREITTHLDQGDIFDVLNQYVHTLLAVNVFKIYLLEPTREQLVMVYCIENGDRLPQDQVSVSDPHANTAHCFRTGAQVLREFGATDDIAYVPGTLKTVTALYYPLSIGERRLGVMAIESLQHQAFGQRELLIFQSLCAYAAIGFDNAHTYLQLQNTQKQLLYHEKMAALGSIVAGVAHELNTPIGNGLLLASSLSDKSSMISQKFQSESLRRSDLVTYLDDCEQASYLILNSFQTAADLVVSFKQVSVDQTTAQRREFNLRQLIEDIVATMRNQFHLAGIDLTQQIPEQLVMDSYPGPLGQVMMNLMQNSLLHAFDQRSDGALSIKVSRLTPEQIRIEVSDNGVGIHTDHLSKIFDPFFTTKLGLGGNGLGLSISYNIVKSILRGDISVLSERGQGTRFIIDLPQRAPLPQD